MTFQEYRQALEKIDDQKSQAYADTKDAYRRISAAYQADQITAREALTLYEEAEQAEDQRITELNQAIDALPEYS